MQIEYRRKDIPGWGMKEDDEKMTEDLGPEKCERRM